MSRSVWHRIGILLFVIQLSNSAGATVQDSIRVAHFFQLSAIAGDGSQAPFLLTANRQGIPSLECSNGYARYGIEINGGIGKSSSWGYSAAADVVAGYNMCSSVSVQQLYAGISWKWLYLNIGIKERFAEMRGNTLRTGPGCDDPLFGKLYGNSLGELGTGGLLYSGNSRPVPQIRLDVPEYVDIPGTDSWLKLRGHIAYGIFLDHDFQRKFTYSNSNARYGKNILYHSKSLFLKVSNQDVFPLEAEGGLEMYSQFGGDIYTHSKGKFLSMPRGIKDYFKAFIPLSGDDSTPTTEQSNISGNQMGNWHLAFTLKTNPVDIRIYGEHLFEDFSQLFFFEYQSNRAGKRTITFYPWRDIQIGLSITNKTGFLRFISNIQYEYTSMYDQSGAAYNDPNEYYKEQMDGVDDYYNHSIYPGWHYYGMGIGNPLAVSPLYNSNGSLVFQGNRFKAHCVGVNGQFQSDMLKYRLVYTYSENWGTYFNPFNEKKYTTSLLADVIFTPARSRWMFSLSLAYDKSNYIGNNWGAMLSLARIGVF